MIEAIFKASLFLHVIAGVLGLSFGLIAMTTRKKGGKLHNKTGIVFYWSMAFIFFTSILFVILYPHELKYHFFLTIGIVSFYPSFSGKRLLSMKKGLNIKWFDWVAALIILISGISMIIYGVLIRPQSEGSYSILFLIFGVLSITQGLGDIRFFSTKSEPPKMFWFFGHAAKMIGAYSAAVTAFFVNVVPRFLPDNVSFFVLISTWVGPVILFALITHYVIRKYKLKFKLA